MIISDEQVHRVLVCLRDHDKLGGLAVRTDWSATPVRPELLERVNAVLAELPETRSDRVAQARSDLADGVYSSEEVAEKILARVISDSLR